MPDQKPRNPELENKREFSLLPLLQVVSGRFLGNWDEMLVLYDFMCGDNITTFVLPEASEFVLPYILEQYPILADISNELPSFDYESKSKETIEAEITRAVEVLTRKYGDSYILDNTKSSFNWKHVSDKDALIRMDPALIDRFVDLNEIPKDNRPQFLKSRMDLLN